MTFTFDPSIADDVSLVRFHVGDTTEDGAYLEDETIQYLVTAGSVGSAVLNCINFIITQLSQPNFQLDWMRVQQQDAKRGYEDLLKRKAQEFGISISGLTGTAGIGLPHRADNDEADFDGAYDSGDLT